MRNLTVCVLAMLWLATPALADDPPNVVLIISDDQHWSHYSFLGHETIETPRIDQLAEQSLTFTRGYVPTSLCRPSLASLITGLQSQEHGITGNDPTPPEGVPRFQARQDDAYQQQLEQVVSMIEDVPTLPRLLAERGYLSHQSGKWWEGHYSRGGFTHGMTHGDIERGGRHGDDGLAIGRDGMEPIFDFIDHAQAEEQPFFVWYAPFMPHTPHNPPERLFEKYNTDDTPPRVARYWAMIEWFDETVGQLLDRLDEQGLAEDTLVIYICDNGWEQVHQQMPLPQNWRQEGYAPRTKRSPYDGGIRTPIMLRWPGEIEPTMDEQTLAHALDLAPTILSAAGLEPTEQMSGLNLLEQDARESRPRIFGAVFEHDMPHPLDEPAAGLRHRWVIEENWKLIYPRYRDGALQDVEIELYDLEQDPRERHNLVEQHPGRALQLMQHVDQWWDGQPRQ